jgi:fatty-acyl-CoA synthase
MEQLWEITLGDLLDQMADKYPDHDCVIYHNGSFRKSYLEFGIWST